MFTRLYTLCATWMVVLLGSPAFAETDLRGICVITFAGKATLGKDFVGVTTAQVCKVAYSGPLSDRLVDLAVSVDWADITTDNIRRDQRMREHFVRNEEQYVYGETQRLPIARLALADSTEPVDCSISLAIGGVTNHIPAIITCPMTRSPSGDELEVGFKVSQAMFDYEPITLMNLFSVRDELDVRARFLLPHDPQASIP